MQGGGERDRPRDIDIKNSPDVLYDFRILLPAFEQVHSDAAPRTTCPDLAVLAVSPRNPPTTLWKSPAIRCRSLLRSETDRVGPQCPYTSIRPPGSGDLRREPNFLHRLVMAPPWPPTDGASLRVPDMTGTLGRPDTAYTSDRSEVQSRPQTRRKTPCGTLNLPRYVEFNITWQVQFRGVAGPVGRNPRPQDHL